MSALVFVDTNVVMYRFDTTEPDKQRQSQHWLERLWSTQAGRLSMQVLQEAYATLTRKMTMPVPEARQIIRALHAWEPVVLDPGILQRAWRLEDRWSMAWSDALIAAAAFASGAAYLLSEDFQSGQDLGGLEVIDPFSVAPEAIL